jgi:molybdenum cofactor cytidylyltransferase
MSYAAIVVAAGFSHRFGSDKRLARINGEPMLLAALRGVHAALADFPGAEMQVVIRARDSVVAPMLAPIFARSPARLVRAPLWPVGMGVSIAAGLDSLLRGGINPDALAVCLGDMPFIQPDTIRRLLENSQAETICIPVHAGERGHPVVFGRRYFPELLALQGGRGFAGAKKIIHRHPQAVREIPVEDPAITVDIDTPADFHSANWPDPRDKNSGAAGTAPDGRAAFPPPA